MPLDSAQHDMIVEKSLDMVFTHLQKARGDAHDALVLMVGNRAVADFLVEEQSGDINAALKQEAYRIALKESNSLDK
mgnify:CR=1 FL=1